MKIMMTMFFVSVLALSGFSSASNQGDSVLTQQDPKEVLIERANSGDVEAMIELDERFLFHQYLPGLILYKEWYDIVLESTDADAIYLYASMYIKYQDMYFDGMIKYLDLLDRAQQLGSNEAFYQLVNMYESVHTVGVFGTGYPGSDEVYFYNNRKVFNDDYSLEDLHIDLIETSSVERLDDLYEYYRTNNGSKELAKKLAEDIKDKLKDEGFSLTLEPAYEAFFDKRISEQKKAKLIDDLLLSDNKKVILFAAGRLRYSNPDKSIEFYEKSLSLDLTERERLISYSVITHIYKKAKDEASLVYFTEKEIEDIGGYNATSDLLEIYQKDAESKQKYEDNFNRIEPYILKDPNAKRALADYLYKSGLRSVGVSMLEELANQGDDEAIVSLAKKTNDKAISDKWLKHILDSNNPKLMLEVSEGHHYYEKGLLKAIYDQTISNGYIYYLRDSYFAFYNEDEAYAIDSMRQLIEAGDAESISNFVSQYDSYDDILKQEYTAYVEDLYQELVEADNLRVIHDFALMHYKSQYFLNKRLGDPKEALKYFEKSADLGNDFAVYQMARFYKYGDETLGIRPNSRKAKFYLKRLESIGADNRIKRL
ncbi:sel1 repeat family protein [Reinekea thalattae]|uniref:Sel1 repeat family protein n=1 Tax=Reinekea thalattae TaxID=2593301 RepID=A0A5C8Z7B6_9GAMM|nr:sel1 repeat family protein [Reinekea thalattae]TXR53128.1 sel1 repeat family protein [Reinekea thalattae]